MAGAATDDQLRLAFPSLSRPGAMFTVDICCVCDDATRGVCRQGELLRQMLLLSEMRVLRMTAKYVVGPAQRDDADDDEEKGQEDTTRIATLQLCVALHERVVESGMTSELHSFEFALSHLQAGLIASRSRRDGSRSKETIATARTSSCHVLGCQTHSKALARNPRRPFLVQDVFQQLMTHDTITETPQVTSPPKRRRRRLHITDLPRAVLRVWLDMLSPRDVTAVSGVCALFLELTYEFVPGLNLQLFSHQKRALRWLLHREGASRGLTVIPHPFMFPSLSLTPHDGNADEENHGIDLVDGHLLEMQNVARASDVRGGLFSDEPGLGKTITMAALILRTKGQRSNLLDIRDESPAVTRKTRVSKRLSTRGREVETDNLLSSAATLIIVPRMLLDHWRFQIATHVAPKRLKVFIDDLDCKFDLPPPETLAAYDVVVTSYDRLSAHWKYHKPRSASELNRPVKYGFEDAPELFVDGFVNRGTSPLLRVHWVRIVVDEGHMLGGKRTLNHMCLAELLHASKRWVMTGTPTPTMYNGDDLRHLHGLLRFLRERPYGESDGKAWTKAIARPFEANDIHGYVRLLHLLKRIMLRHTKASILKQIPAPTRHVVLVDPTPSEYAAYNGILTGIRINLVANRSDPSDPSGGKLNHNSLLHAKNRGHVRNAVRNLRNATCGGGSVQVALHETDYLDTLAMLRGRAVGLERVKKVQTYLEKSVGRDFRCVCPMCTRTFHALMLLPCGHFVCADCTDAWFDRHGLSCGVCPTTFEWTEFQELQPGYELMIKEDTWYYDGKELFTTPRRRKKGVPGQELPKTKRVFIPINFAKFSEVSTSKTYYVTRRIVGLLDEFDDAEAQRRRGRCAHGVDDASSLSRPKVPKIIVFSQMRDSIFKLKITLGQHDIPSEDFLTYASAADRTAALIAFRNDPTSNVLLLSDAGRMGSIYQPLDESLENQVVARAHRMGAQHSVVVKKLRMRGSLKEFIHSARQNKRRNGNQEEDDDGEDDEDDRQRSKGFYRDLLCNLRPIDVAHQAKFGFLRFQVHNEDGTLVHADTVRLPNPGNPPPEPVVTGFIVRRPVEQPTSERSDPAPSGESHSGPQEEAEPAVETSPMGGNQAETRVNDTVRVKSEPHTCETNSKCGDHATRTLIDLTSDTDDDDSDATVEVVEIDGGHNCDDHSVHDDSETDDEWTPCSRKRQ